MSGTSHRLRQRRWQAFSTGMMDSPNDAWTLRGMNLKDEEIFFRGVDMLEVAGVPSIARLHAWSASTSERPGNAFCTVSTAWWTVALNRFPWCSTAVPRTRSAIAH